MPSLHTTTARGLLLNKYFPFPTEKQAAFLLLPYREAFYGGAAGGGKSAALLMGALQYVHVPGYAALLLRRSYPDLALPGALMDMAASWLGGTDAKWNERDKTWTFPSGATLTFGYLEHEKDKYRYRGAEFQYIALDELTQYSETQYTYLFSRLRRLAASDVPLRMRSASNPGDVGHLWVKQRFLVEGLAQGRPFVPAKLADNPHIDATEYLESLALLDPITRAQLREGDWEIQAEGRLFQRVWFPIVEDWPRDGRLVRFWDLAATAPRPGIDPDWTVGVLMAEKGGQYWLVDLQRFRASPKTVEETVAQVTRMDGIKVTVAKEQEPGASGKAMLDHYRRNVIPFAALTGFRSTGNKVEYARPLSAAAEAGNVFLVHGRWNAAFLEEAMLFPDGPHDDQIDAASKAKYVLSQPKAARRIALRF